MANPDDGAERNQEPTQKRLDEARRDGRVLTSKEMMVFASMAAGTLFVVILSALGPMTATRWAAHLQIGSGDALDAALMPAIVEAGKQVLALALFIAVPVAVTSVLRPCNHEQTVQSPKSGLWHLQRQSFGCPCIQRSCRQTKA